jgi:hypothetical protein
MTQYWIEQLQFSVEVFDEYGNLLEVLARLHDLDAARAAYGACRLKYPARSSTRAGGSCSAEPATRVLRG